MTTDRCDHYRYRLNELAFRLFAGAIVVGLALFVLSLVVLLAYGEHRVRADAWLHPFVTVGMGGGVMALVTFLGGETVSWLVAMGILYIRGWACPNCRVPAEPRPGTAIVVTPAFSVEIVDDRRPRGLKDMN